MSDKPGMNIPWEDLIILIIIGAAIWFMLGALGYTAWLWLG